MVIKSCRLPNLNNAFETIRHGADEINIYGAEAAVHAHVPVRVPVEEEPAAREKISTEPSLKR